MRERESEREREGREKRKERERVREPLLASPISYRTDLFIQKRNSVNGIIRLLGSDMVWPKVIPLSGAYCASVLSDSF